MHLNRYRWMSQRERFQACLWLLYQSFYYFSREMLIIAAAFRNRWRANLRTMSQAERERAEERLEELLTSKEYWESIQKLRRREWFARSGSNLYKEIKGRSTSSSAESPPVWVDWWAGVLPSGRPALCKQLFLPPATSEIYPSSRNSLNPRLYQCWLPNFVELVQPGTISEQHLNADLKELYSQKYYGELDDYLTGNDYAAAILWLRGERFFKAPEVFENYYMDEDVSESGYSSLNSVLGGQVGHTPEFPRDRLHREALAKASMGFKPYTEIIPDPLDNTQPRTSKKLNPVAIASWKGFSFVPRTIPYLLTFNSRWVILISGFGSLPCGDFSVSDLSETSQVDVLHST